MDRSTPIYLVSESFSENGYGVLKPTRTKRLVYADIQSVNANEWFEGGRNGLNPQYRFTMFAPDYKGEEIVQYRGVDYSIYRTYFRRTDIIELYAEYKKGEAKSDAN